MTSPITKIPGNTRPETPREGGKPPEAGKNPSVQDNKGIAAVRKGIKSEKKEKIVRVKSERKRTAPKPLIRNDSTTLRTSQRVSALGSGGNEPVTLETAANKQRGKKRDVLEKLPAAQLTLSGSATGFPRKLLKLKKFDDQLKQIRKAPEGLHEALLDAAESLDTAEGTHFRKDMEFIIVASECKKILSSKRLSNEDRARVGELKAALLDLLEGMDLKDEDANEFRTRLVDPGEHAPLSALKSAIKERKNKDVMGTVWQRMVDRHSPDVPKTIIVEREAASALSGMQRLLQWDVKHKNTAYDVYIPKDERLPKYPTPQARKDFCARHGLTQKSFVLNYLELGTLLLSPKNDEVLVALLDYSAAAHALDGVQFALHCMLYLRDDADISKGISKDAIQTKLHEALSSGTEVNLELKEKNALLNALFGPDAVALTRQTLERFVGTGPFSVTWGEFIGFMTDE